MLVDAVNFHGIIVVASRVITGMALLRLTKSLISTEIRTLCCAGITSTVLITACVKLHRRCVSTTPQQCVSAVPQVHKIWTVPNALCIARMAASPFIVSSILSGGLSTATGLLAAAGVTDYLDGYIARKYNQQSVLGTFLDPLADKVLVSATSIAMACTGLLSMPLVCLTLSRDAILLAGGAYYRIKSVKSSSLSEIVNVDNKATFSVQPTMLSKWNTALYLGLMTITLVSSAFPLALPVNTTVLNTLSCVVAATTVTSGLQYMMDPTLALKPVK